MRVIQILPKLKAGGVERGVLDLASFFRDSKDFPDFESLVVSSGGSLLYLLDQIGVAHREIRVERKSPLSLLAVPKVARLILKEKPDIIHARSRVPAWISFFASRNKDCHFITTAHGMYQSKNSSQVMGWGKFVICPSKVVARHMKDNYGVPEEKIVIISRWVDIDRFKLIDSQTLLENNSIVSIGRITPSKGYEHLIKAFQKVVRFNPYLKLKIVGSVDSSKQRYMDRLKTLVTRFSLGYNVQFLGYRQDIEKVLAQARVLVVPSLIEEAFGRVVVEAAACGVPVVATKVGGLEEIISHGRDGLLVPPADSQSLADAILKIVENPSLAERMSEQARQKVEKKYTMEKSLTSLEAVYRRAINQKRILVAKISSLGDVILIIPALAQLHKSFPGAKIYLLTLNKYANLFYDCPYIDKVFTVAPDYKKIKSIFKVSKELRRFSFDYLIDLQNNRASQLISFFSFARKSFGFGRKLGFLLNYTAPYKRAELIDPLSSQEKILKLLGVHFLQKKLKFWQSQEIEISHLQLGTGKFIGLGVAAPAHCQTKNWPLENINGFIKLCLKEFSDYTILLLGDTGCREKGTALKNSHKSQRILNLCGKTSLRELIQVFKQLSFFVAPDIATLHLAQSLGVEVIGLFGPTDPRRHTVPAANLQIIDKGLACGPCYRDSCSTRECMQSISSREVFLKAQVILKKAKEAS